MNNDGGEKDRMIRKREKRNGKTGANIMKQVYNRNYTKHTIGAG